jgi:CBS domain containing-hemolysin-like protein
VRPPACPVRATGAAPPQDIPCPGACKGISRAKEGGREPRTCAKTRGREGARANPFHPRQRLRAFLREGAAEGVITGYQDELVERVLALRERQVRDAMAVVRNPRGRAVGIITIKDLVEEIVGELAAW